MEICKLQTHFLNRNNLNVRGDKIQILKVHLLQEYSILEVSNAMADTHYSVHVSLQRHLNLVELSKCNSAQYMIIVCDGQRNPLHPTPKRKFIHNFPQAASAVIQQKISNKLSQQQYYNHNFIQKTSSFFLVSLPNQLYSVIHSLFQRVIPTTYLDTVAVDSMIDSDFYFTKTSTY